MLPAALILVIACLGILGYAVFIEGGDRRRRGPVEHLPKAASNQVILHTRDGHTIRGVLGGVYADVVAIQHASYLNGDGSREPVAGDQLVPHANVSWFQTNVEE